MRVHCNKDHPSHFIRQARWGLTIIDGRVARQLIFCRAYQKFIAITILSFNLLLRFGLSFSPTSVFQLIIKHVKNVLE
jgi:hypothetical protein